MNKKEVIKNYLSKIQNLKNYNKFYYEKNAPEVDDKRYDELKNEILNLEKKYSFLDNKDSPSKNVGYKPKKNLLIKRNVPLPGALDVFFTI